MNDEIKEILNMNREDNIERILELLIYSLIKHTKIYNHELATNTLNTMKNIVCEHLEDNTDDLTYRLLYYWNNMDKYFKVGVMNK